jgi:hypothetical protein
VSPASARSPEETVDPAKRFFEYAAAFDKAYADDDWTRLEPYFTDDAVYAVTGGPPLGGRFEGRDRVISHLRESVEELDRRFAERRIEPLAEPEIEGDTVSLRWRCTYVKTWSPDLVFDGTERATFAGDRIRLLEDIVDDGTDGRIQAYLKKYFG